MKYDEIIEMLNEDDLYTPATITGFAEKNGFIKAAEKKARLLEKQRIRIAMGRFSNNHGFPDEGDGMVRVKGQAPTPGWFGWRWKAALYDQYRE